jgi:hypothetical protein
MKVNDFSFDWPPTSDQYFNAADWIVKNSNSTIDREEVAEALAVICTLSSSANVPILIPNIWPDYSLEILFVPPLNNRPLPKLSVLELSKSALDVVGKAFSSHLSINGNDTFLLEEHGMSLYIYMKHVRHTILQATGVELIS